MLLQPAPKPSMSSVPLTVIGELRSQLQETQNALTSYSDKFHILNSLITEHSSFKHDIDLIKVFMEECKQEAQMREQHNEFLNDNDNACSITTVAVNYKPSNLLSQSLMTTIIISQSHSHIPDNIIHSKPSPASSSLHSSSPNPSRLNKPPQNTIQVLEYKVTKL